MKFTEHIDSAVNYLNMLKEEYNSGHGLNEKFFMSALLSIRKAIDSESREKKKGGRLWSSWERIMVYVDRDKYKTII